MEFALPLSSAVILVGDGKNEVKPEMSPLLMYRHPGKRLILRDPSKRNFTCLSMEIMKIAIRDSFFIMVSAMQTEFDNLYPFASSLNYDPRGNSIGEFDLDLYR